MNVPHFDYPFRFGGGGSVVVVEQNSDKDVMNCIYAAVKTERGGRLYVPTFGIDDPTFSEAPLDLATIESQIRDSEPRANINTAQEIEELIDTITVGVGVVGQ